MNAFFAMIVPVGGGVGGPVDPGFFPPGVGPGQPGGPGGVGGTPPGYWGGGPHPMQPIASPPSLYPDIGLPGQQPPPGTPSHPIALPPGLPPTLPPPDQRPIEWKTAWTARTGWVVVGVPTGPAPTPSA